MSRRGPVRARLLPVVLLLLPARAANAAPPPAPQAMGPGRQSLWAHGRGAAFAALPMRAAGGVVLLPRAARRWMLPAMPCAGLRAQAGGADAAPLKDPKSVNRPVRVTSWTRGETGQPFTEIIDVRSPSEYAEDHIPGAINLPCLTDEQRHEVGLLYDSSPFLARKTVSRRVCQRASCLRKGERARCCFRAAAFALGAIPA